MPFDEKEGLHKTEGELKQTGVLVEQPVMPEVPQGKMAVMYYNPVNNTAFYELEDIPPQPPTLEERNRADIDYLSIMTGVDLSV
jgi:hypothetical protein